MPGRRSRSPTPDRYHRRSKRRDEYEDEDDRKDRERKTVESLSAVGVKEISESDYLCVPLQLICWADSYTASLSTASRQRSSDYGSGRRRER